MATNNPTAVDSLNVLLPGLYRHGRAYRNSDGEVHIYLPERLLYLEEYEPATHVCRGGERLQDIAVERYKGLVKDPLDMVDIIAQYQQDKIIDTSIRMRQGTVLLLPSLSYVREVAYGDSLAEFPKIA